MLVDPEPPKNRWADAWPDALAFAGGLALAWWAGWATSDLVWSLWLSSLVVGYAMIVWTIFGPVLRFGRQAAEAMAIKVNGKELALGAMGPAAVVFGSLFLLAFFTFHFGLFHFVHSVFLKTFLPIEGYDARSMPGPGYYWEVVRRYWLFLPLAFLAERQAFRLSLPADPGKRDTAVTAGASAERQAGKAKPGGMNDMMAPYKNVVRMHLLIFFFAFAHFAKLESFLVYAVVYAAYFFPWRLVGKKAIPAA
jgi:hypothetical protein